MEKNFVSDISSNITILHNQKNYKKIYDIINDHISNLDTADPMNYNAAYRLQQDIAILNTTLLTDISKYVNTNTNRSNLNSNGEEEDKSKQSTFKEQSESTKLNLQYKYFYLVIKLLVIFALFGLIYFKLIIPSNNNPAPKPFGELLN